MAFPPVPVYPNGLDSDYTLYLVHDTTETKLSEDNSPWSQEIEIVPVLSTEEEIWPSNGFANIEGELLYYDSVELNEYDKVKKLKGCSRNLGGEATKFNKKGTWIRSFVVAEQHNQLVDAITKVENFVGRNFDDRQETLDWRIRNLQELTVIFDDFACPDVSFTFNVIENDSESGILTEYDVEITPPGSISSFRLDFGDGEFTTSALSGQHRYAINARIDPVVRVSNDKCQIVQTPIERSDPTEPSPEVVQVFEAFVPETTPFPDFTVVPCDIPEPEFNLPPIVIPCVSLTSGDSSFPSIITGPTINMVSQVTITANNPVQILHSVVTITGGENIPSLIIIDPPIPPTIIIDPPIPPTIVIVPPQSNITLDLDFSAIPRLEVDWGVMPEMEVQLTMAKAVKSPERFTTDPELVKEFGAEFADLFEVNQKMKVEYEPVGIPSEIMVIVPEDMKIKLDTSDLEQRRIKVDCSEANIPRQIQIYGPECPIPNSISFDASQLFEAIEMMKSIPAIKLDASEVPQSIKVEMEKDIPSKIIVEMPKPIPSKIIVESNLPDRIILEGPASIPISIPDNIFIPVKFPDKMPTFEAEMVFKGSPIEVKLTMDQITGNSTNKGPCVMLVPCTN